MPAYDYKCKKCNHIFEVYQSIHDDCLKECPKCDGEIFRLISKTVLVGEVLHSYFDTSIGKVINGKSDMKEHCKRNGGVFLSDNEAKQQFAANRKRQDMEFKEKQKQNDKKIIEAYYRK